MRPLPSLVTHVHSNCCSMQTKTPLGAGFSQLEQPPSLFVLMGPFQSYDAAAAAGRYPRMREHFAALGRVINQYPALRVGLARPDARACLPWY